MVGPAAPARFPGCEGRWTRGKKLWFSRMSETTTAGQDGAFVLDTLPTGQYCVYVQPHPDTQHFMGDGRPPQKRIPELAHTRAALSATLEVKAGQRTEGAKVVLTAAGALAGKIADADTAEPLKGHVWIMPSGFHQGNLDEVPDARSTSFNVEEDGSFQMPGLLPGKYDINISVQGPYESVNKRAQVIKAGETLNLNLKLKPRRK